MPSTSSAAPARDLLISYLQIIGIISVVVYHSCFLAPQITAVWWVYDLLGSYHMPLFFFISGYLMYYIERIVKKDHPTSAKKFVAKKVKRLMVPFVVLELVTFLPRVAFNAAADTQIPLSWHSFLGAFLYEDGLVIVFFWFLQAIFLTLLLGFAITSGNVKRQDILLGVVAVAAAIISIWHPFATYFLSISKGMTYLVFFFVGMLCAYHYRALRRQLERYAGAVSLAACVLWLGMYILYRRAGLSFYPSEVLRVATGCAAILFWAAVAQLLVNHRCHILDFLDGATYTIFLLSWYGNVASQQLLAHLVSLPWWVYTLLSIITGIFIPYLAYRFLRGRDYPCLRGII